MGAVDKFGRLIYRIRVFGSDRNTWETYVPDCQNPECPKAGKCNGECANNF